MPTVHNRGADLFYATEGEDGPPIVFVNEAGLGGWLWGWQHAALAGPFRTVVWDLRGTGRSGGADGPHTLETYVSDFEAVCRDAGHRRVHAVGLGLGGAVALAAARGTNRVETLTLVGTAAHEDVFSLERLFDPLVDVDGASSGDAGPPSDGQLRESLEAALSSAFCDRQPDVVDGIAEWRREGDADPDTALAQVGALGGFDARGWLVEVTQPTQVLHGTGDDLVSAEAGEALVQGLPRGAFVPLEGAGHLATVERSRRINDLVFGFLESSLEECR